jgi:hypothetical protein
MRTVKIIRGTNTIIEYRPEAKNSMVKPGIKKEFFQGRGKERTRMYETVDGRTFHADKFDLTFNQQVQFKMKPKNFKASSIDPRVIY